MNIKKIICLLLTGSLLFAGIPAFPIENFYLAPPSGPAILDMHAGYTFTQPPDEVTFRLIQEWICEDVREKILDMVYQAQSGHLGGAASMVELLVSLFFGGLMQYNPDDPEWELRDRLILSKGHGSAGLYAILAEAGFFAHLIGPDKEFKTIDEFLASFRKFGSPLQGHPERVFRGNPVPGVELSTGRLGQGLSAAAGIAAAMKLKNLISKVYCVLGDGEIQEGQIYEAMIDIPKRNLDNVVAVLDYNHYQIDTKVEDVNVGLKRIKQMWQSSGWEVIEVENGNKIDEVLQGLHAAKANNEKPVLVILNTEKGYGMGSKISENPLSYHGSAPDEPIYNEAKGVILSSKKQRIGALQSKIKSEIDMRDIADAYIQKIIQDGISDRKERYEADRGREALHLFNDAQIKAGTLQREPAGLIADMPEALWLNQTGFQNRRQHMVSFATGLSRGGKIPFVDFQGYSMDRVISQIEMCALSHLGMVLLDSSGRESTSRFMRFIPGVEIINWKEKTEIHKDDLQKLSASAQQGKIMYVELPAEEEIPAEDNIFKLGIAGGICMGLQNNRSLMKSIHIRNNPIVTTLDFNDMQDGLTQEAMSHIGISKLRRVNVVLRVSPEIPRDDVVQFENIAQAYGWVVIEAKNAEELADKIKIHGNQPCLIVLKTDDARSIELPEGIFDIDTVIKRLRSMKKTFNQGILEESILADAPASDDDKAEEATRKAFADALAQIAQANKDSLWTGSADLLGSVKLNIWKSSTEKRKARLTNFGIRERYMFLCAAGMFLTNRIPIIGTFDVFTSMTLDEMQKVEALQIGVVMVGSHGGTRTALDGASHESVGTPGYMQSVEGIETLEPCDAITAQRLAIKACELADQGNLVHVRLHRPKLPVLKHPEDYNDYAYSIYDNRQQPDESLDLTIVASGVTVAEAINAAQKLSKEGKKVKVINILRRSPGLIEPLADLIEGDFYGGTIITVFDGHWRVLRDLVEQAVSFKERRGYFHIQSLGMHTFGESGSPEELARHFELDAHAIFDEAHEIEEFLISPERPSYTGALRADVESALERQITRDEEMKFLEENLHHSQIAPALLPFVKYINQKGIDLVVSCSKDADPVGTGLESLLAELQKNGLYKGKIPEFQNWVISNARAFSLGEHIWALLTAQERETNIKEEAIIKSEKVLNTQFTETERGEILNNCIYDISTLSDIFNKPLGEAVLALCTSRKGRISENVSKKIPLVLKPLLEHTEVAKYLSAYSEIMVLDDDLLNGGSIAQAKLLFESFGVNYSHLHQSVLTRNSDLEPIEVMEEVVVQVVSDKNLRRNGINVRTFGRGTGGRTMHKWVHDSGIRLSEWRPEGVTRYDPLVLSSLSYVPDGLGLSRSKIGLLLKEQIEKHISKEVVKDIDRDVLGRAIFYVLAHELNQQGFWSKHLLPWKVAEDKKYLSDNLIETKRDELLGAIRMAFQTFLEDIDRSGPEDIDTNRRRVYYDVGIILFKSRKLFQEVREGVELLLSEPALLAMTQACLAMPLEDRSTVRGLKKEAFQLSTFIVLAHHLLWQKTHPHIASGEPAASPAELTSATAGQSPARSP
ncbi:MAG: 1-deoxy-D-xylulose-5-phosphate synthase N-terminal domain-containing protein [bacterium]